MDEDNHPLNRKDPMLDQSTHDDGLTSSHTHSLCPSCNYSDEYAANPRPLIKCTEGIHFDLQRITDLLTSLDTYQQCAALQLLNYAAQWASTNFTDCVSVTFRPVVELLFNSKNIQVHCAALDTLKRFLASPSIIVTIKPMMPFILHSVLNDLNSPQQLASIELINAATQSEEILVEFAPAISRLSTLLSSMPAATQVTALRVLEVSAGSNAYELVKAVTDTLHCLIHPLLSPETTVQASALKVLEASVGTKTREVFLAAVILLRILVGTLSSGETDTQSAARKVLEEVDFESYIPSADIQELQRFPCSSGGFADVRKCSVSTPSGTRIVAVKSVRVFRVDDALYMSSRRIHREAYVWIQLSHKHILHFEGITDCFGPLPALVSLWMENGTLNDYLKREFHQLTNPRKLELIQQVAAGVSYLHGKDIVHGDLAGTNVLVDGSGYIRIAGFGSSMLLAEAENEIFRSSMLLAEAENETFRSSGSWNTRWTAPEFLAFSFEDDGELKLVKPTKPGDIYSFGCVMLQILSGKVPYASISMALQVIQAIILGRIPFHGLPNIIETFRDLSSQCLSREPELRPSIIEIIDIVGHVDNGGLFSDGDATDRRLKDSDPPPEGLFGNNSRHDPSVRNSIHSSILYLAMSDLHATYVQVDFKIKPTLIPSTAITRLAAFPHGSGALGDVWKCSMSTPSGTRTVAVKSIRVGKADNSELLRQGGRRIRREAYVWIQLLHDHIVPFEGITDGFGLLPALVSLWMENGTLNEYLKWEFPKLSDWRKLNFVRQVAAGLGYLHKKDIVHGDLTPVNILLDDCGNLRLADFGQSMVVSESGNLTFGSLQAGHTRWIAPEFVACADDSEAPVKPTKAGDIYSFGCVMLQILSGKEPYSQFKNPMQAIFTIGTRENPFHRVDINMDKDYRLLSSRCLSMKPKRRPSIIEITAIFHPVRTLAITPHRFLIGSSVCPKMGTGSPV